MDPCLRQGLNMIEKIPSRKKDEKKKKGPERKKTVKGK
jgi:hypothetical protein